MKNSILKNKNINKLSKNEFEVYNALQEYQKNDKLQLFISSYLAGNKSKDLYNKKMSYYTIIIKIIKFLKKNIKTL